MKKIILFNELFISRQMKTDSETDLFEKAFNEIAENVIMEDFEDICKCFNDETEYRDIMHGLVHLLEDLYKINPETYILKLINGYNDFLPHAKWWYYILIKRVLNGENIEIYNIAIDLLKNDDKLKIKALLKEYD